MKRTLATLLACAAVASAQSGIAAPRVGFIGDRSGALRPVFGLAGNFVLGEPVTLNVVAAAFSGDLGLVKTEDSLVVFGREGQQIFRRSSNGGRALFAFSPLGRDALAFLPDTGELLRWRQDRFWRVFLDGRQVAGEVVAIAAPARNWLRLVVRRETTFWFLEASLVSGRVETESPLAGVSAPLLLRADGTLVFTDGDEAVLRKTNGTERRFTVGSRVTSLSEMGESWVHVVEEGEDPSEAKHLALRLLEDHEELYRLPEVTP